MCWSSLGRSFEQNPGSSMLIMLRRPQSWTGRYGVAVLAVALALLTKALLAPFVVGQSPFLLLTVAVLASAAFGGLGPAILATLLGAFVGDYFFLSPVGTLVPPNAAHGFRTLFFVVQGLAISAIGAALVSVGQRAESSAHQAEEGRENLRASESRLEEAQRIARIGNWDYDVLRDEAYWSDELYRIFGFEPQEFVPRYKTFLRFVHPEDRRIVQEAIREAAGGASQSRVEYRIVRPGGEVRAVSTECEPIIGDSGRMLRLVGTIQDVTERRRAEDALRESEERYRVVAETASDAIIVIGEDGLMKFVNEAAGGTFGYATEEMLGEGLTMLMPERLGPLHQSAFERHLATGERQLDWRSIKLPGLHRSGREISLELSFGEFVRDGERFFTGFIRDITERERTEEALRETEERYRAAIEQAGDGIFLFDAETTRIVEANPALGKMLGYDLGELLRMSLYDLVPESPQSVEENVRYTLEHGYFLVGERGYRRKDGSVAEVEVSGNVISFEGRRLVCAVARDVTERNRAEEAMREVREAERTRIAREMHDTVLQEIVYALQEMQIIPQIYEGLPQALVGSLEETAEALRGSVEGLREAIFELRLEDTAGRSMREALGSLVDLNRRMVRRAYELELVVEEAFPDRVSGAVSQSILRVVQEALTNVRRHASPEYVRVRLGIEEGWAWAEVSNDGRGFEPGSGHIGIGSHSMRQRATELGGELSVQSSPGRGTVVKLWVPCERLG